MGVFFGSTGMTPWIQTLIVNHLNGSSGDGTTEQDLPPHRPRLVQIVGRGGTWWQNPDAASPSSCYLEITDGQHSIQVHLTPTCQASLRQQHFQYADQCRQGCLVVIEQYTVQIQNNNNNGEEIALLSTHIQLKGGSETGICHPLEPIQDSVEVKRHLQQYKFKKSQQQQQQQQKDTSNTNTNRPVVVIGDVNDLFASTHGQNTVEQILEESKRRQVEDEKQETTTTTTRQESSQGDNNHVAMLRVGNVEDLLESQDDAVMEQVLGEARRLLTTIQPPEETTEEENNGEWRVPPVPRKLGNVQELLQSPETLEAVLQLAETAMAAEQMIMEEDNDDGDNDNNQKIVRKQPRRLGGPPLTVPHWSDSDDDDDDDDAVLGISKLLDSQPTQELESESTKLEHPEREVKIRGDWSESDDDDVNQGQVWATTTTKQRAPLASSNLPPNQRERQGMSASVPTEPESTRDFPPRKRVSNQADSQDQGMALSTEQEVPTPLNDNRSSKRQQRPPIPNYEAIGTTVRSPSEKSDKENASSEQRETIKARASKPIAEKKKSKKRTPASSPSSGTSKKKKKRTTSLWQRLANNQATASLKTKIVTGVVGGLSSWLSRNSK